MPSGKARFNRPATTAARLADKAPAMKPPFTDSFWHDVGDLIGKLDTKRPPNADDLAALKTQVGIEGDWAWGQVQSLDSALTAADKLVECNAVMTSLKRTVTDLRKMSWEVDLFLGPDFDWAGIADDADALTQRLDDAADRLARVLASYSTRNEAAKPSSISERSRIADELAIRIDQAIAQAGLKVTASSRSPAVRLIKLIGDSITLASDETTWRDRMNRAKRDRIDRAKRLRRRKKADEPGPYGKVS